MGVSPGRSPLEAWRDPHGLRQGANAATQMGDRATINGGFDDGRAADLHQRQVSLTVHGITRYGSTADDVFCICIL